MVQTYLPAAKEETRIILLNGKPIGVNRVSTGSEFRNNMAAGTVAKTEITEQEQIICAEIWKPAKGWLIFFGI